MAFAELGVVIVIVNVSLAFSLALLYHGPPGDSSVDSSVAPAVFPNHGPPGDSSVAPTMCQNLTLPGDSNVPP